MPNKHLTLLKAKNYTNFITSLPGAAMWQHLYVIDERGNEIDVTENGDKSCAYMVSSVLCIFGVIDKPHATVKTTLEEMEKAGWQKVGKPTKGAVVRWKDHIGFYLTDDFVISSSSLTKVITRHGLIMSDGLEPIDFFTHPELL